MKRIVVSLILCNLILLVSGCSPQPIIYHSEASLPYYNRATKTVFELINDANTSKSIEFGVVSAKDNDTLSYVLLAPVNTGDQNVTSLVKANLTYSVPLLPKQVKEFLNILNASSDKWSTKYGKKDGISYEFIVAPENLIVKSSDNVNTWYSTFKYYFQNNEGGPVGTVLFGEGLFQFKYELNELSQITNLINMLNLAINNK
jgi:hypothetical protein